MDSKRKSNLQQDDLFMKKKKVKSENLDLANDQEYNQFLQDYSEGRILNTDDLRKKLIFYLDQGNLKIDKHENELEQLCIGYCYIWLGKYKDILEQNYQEGARLINESFEKKACFMSYILKANLLIQEIGSYFDIQKTFELLEKAKDLQPENSESFILKALIIEGQSKKKYQNLIKKAFQLGSIQATAYMGLFYYKGEFVQKKDLAKSKACFEKVEADGDQNDLFTLGQIYQEQLNQIQKAIEIYKKSNSIDSLIQLAQIEKQKENEQGYSEYLKKAVEIHSSAEARFLLYEFYNQQPDQQQQALEFLAKSAQQGYSLAQYTLGNNLCEKGEIKLGSMWLELASSQGEDQAMLLMGKLYLNDKSGTIKPDTEKAEDFIIKSAQQGNEEAYEFLQKLLNKEDKQTKKKTKN